MRHYRQPTEESARLLSPTEALVIKAARDLRSESGENPEYDRALVDLVGTVLGFNLGDDRERVERLLKIVKR